VSAARALAPEIREVELTLEDPPELGFEAGQWVSVPFGPRQVRAYSIASTPRSPRRITLCADVAPAGPGSTWFRGLAPGDVVEFKAPFGGFVFRHQDPRRPFFVAEEIGIVPVRSILAELDAIGFARPLTLVYRARDPSWLAYHDELASLARRRPHFAYHPVVDAAGPEWQGRRGDVAGVVEALAGDGADCVAYVAGGGAMIDRVRGILMARGLDRKSIRWEKFW
jgi:ferredoxin-NADP reductase